VIWALGFELGPNLHVALHAHLAHHHHHHGHGHGHAPSGATSTALHWVPADGARVEAGAEGTAADGQWRADGRAIGPERTDDPGHGEHSLAHRDLALAEPPPPPAIDAMALVGFAPAAAMPAETPRSRGPDTVRQRGPPAPLA
jgi:hypothetical protein